MPFCHDTRTYFEPGSVPCGRLRGSRRTWMQNERDSLAMLRSPRRVGERNMLVRRARYARWARFIHIGDYLIGGAR